jgi:hypothetical protein
VKRIQQEMGGCTSKEEKDVSDEEGTEVSDQEIPGPYVVDPSVEIKDSPIVPAEQPPVKDGAPPFVKDGAPRKKFKVDSEEARHRRQVEVKQLEIQKMEVEAKLREQDILRMIVQKMLSAK